MDQVFFGQPGAAADADDCAGWETEMERAEHTFALTLTLGIVEANSLGRMEFLALHYTWIRPVAIEE